MREKPLAKRNAHTCTGRETFRTVGLGRAAIAKPAFGSMSSFAAAAAMRARSVTLRAKAPASARYSRLSSSRRRRESVAR